MLFLIREPAVVALSNRTNRRFPAQMNNVATKKETGVSKRFADDNGTEKDLMQDDGSKCVIIVQFYILY